MLAGCSPHETHVSTGLPGVAAVSWGTHICQFYRSRADLEQVLVPYFREGLASGDHCVWVASEPFGVDAARDALARVVPDLAAREARHQIQLFDHADWYARSGGSQEGVLRLWQRHAQWARESGFRGLRLTGNTYWLDHKHWQGFAEYEAAVHEAFHRMPVLALCSYSVERCTADEVLDVMHNHAFALLRRAGAWEVVRGATHLLGALDAADGEMADGAGDARDRGRLVQVHPRSSAGTATDRLMGVQRVMAALSEVQVLGQVPDVIAHEVAPTAGAHTIVTAIAEDGDEPLRLLADAGGGGPAEAPPTVEVSRPLVDVFRGGMPVWLGTRVEADARYPELGVAALAAIPLRVGGRTMGATAFLFAEVQPFDALQRALVEDLARQMALTIDRASLFEQSERQRDRLARASRAKDDFLAMLGHELRNPLAAIGSVAELLKLSQTADTIRRTQPVLERQTAHMAKLVDGLLDVSRMVRGKVTIERVPVALATLVRQVCQDRATDLAGCGLDLDLRLGDSDAWVEGDRVRLVQVLDNLLSNAIKFTGPAGTVGVTLHEEGGHVTVSVRDTGAGIDPAFLPHIFEPFEQAPQGLSREGGGLGLGLALVRHLVALHGGDVQAHSEGLGHGAEFRVCLPRIDAPEARPSSIPPPAGSVRILLVEDNVDSAEILREVLARDGHPCAVAHAGEAAVTLARRWAPQVVLCDIGLPGTMSGYDVARALRCEAPLAGAFLVAVSGYGGAADIARAREAGYDAHLTKPVDIKALRALIARGTARPQDADRP
jgi:signal transduction histidine kinase/ActR/RegA family two-component response regulator